MNHSLMLRPSDVVYGISPNTSEIFRIQIHVLFDICHPEKTEIWFNVSMLVGLLPGGAS